MRYWQRQEIHNLWLERDYNSKIALDPLSKEEINWWISNLRLSNGRSVISHQVELLIQSDASKTGWGAFCQKTSIGGVWSGRQGFRRNEKFVKQMDIKQVNIFENESAFRTSGFRSVCIQVVPTDPKVHNLATRSTWMDGGCISNKLDTPKSIHIPSFCFCRENVSQSSEG